MWTRPLSAYRIILLGLGCALFVYLFVRTGAAQINALMQEIGWRLALIALVYAGHELIRAAAYRKCIVGTMPSYWDILTIRLSGDAVQFLTSTGPFLAEPAKVWLLRGRGLGTQHAVAATITEYLSYTFTSAALAVAGVTYLLGNFQLSGAMTAAAKTIVGATCAFLAASAYAIVSRIYLIGAIVQGVRRFPLFGKRLPFSGKDLREIEDLLFAVLRDRPLRFFSILATEFAAQALLVLELLIFLRSAEQTFALIDPLVIEAAAKYAGLAFFFIPGQVGASEGAYALIFKAVGLPASAGFVLAFVRRLRSLLIAGVGLVLARRA